MFVNDNVLVLFSDSHHASANTIHADIFTNRTPSLKTSLDISVLAIYRSSMEIEFLLDFYQWRVTRISP